MDHEHMTHSSVVVDGRRKTLAEKFNFCDQETTQNSSLHLGNRGSFMGNGVHATSIDVSGFWHRLQ